MDVSQAEYQYISEGFKKLRADFAEKHKPVSAAEDAARSAAIIARNDVVIIEEYHMAGLIPVVSSNGRPVSLYLARMMNLPIEQAFIAEEEHAA
jgi:hypothetical protein